MASQDPNLTGLTDTCGDTSCTTGAAVTSEPIALKMIPVNPLYVSSNDNQAVISPSTFDPERPLNLTNRSVAHSTTVSSTVTMPMYLMVPVHSLKDRVGTHSEVSTGSTTVSSGELTRLLLTPSAAGITSISNIRGAQTTLVTQSVMNTPPLKISKRTYNPVSTKHLYNICTMLDQRRRCWADVVQMLYNVLCLLEMITTNTRC